MIQLGLEKFHVEAKRIVGFAQKFLIVGLGAEHSDLHDVSPRINALIVPKKKRNSLAINCQLRQLAFAIHACSDYVMPTSCFQRSGGYSMAALPPGGNVSAAGLQGPYQKPFINMQPYKTRTEVVWTAPPAPNGKSYAAVTAYKHDKDTPTWYAFTPPHIPNGAATVAAPIVYDEAHNPVEVVVEIFRRPALGGRALSIELPGGGLEITDRNPLARACVELQEELGYVADPGKTKLISSRAFASDPGQLAVQIALFELELDKNNKVPANRDAHEQKLLLKAVSVPIDDFINEERFFTFIRNEVVGLKKEGVLTRDFNPDNFIPRPEVRWVAEKLRADRAEAALSAAQAQSKTLNATA
jgi:8-oxo-dGTP pyrophosphatase MutT (NUDIX family)